MVMIYFDRALSIFFLHFKYQFRIISDNIPIDDLLLNVIIEMDISGDTGFKSEISPAVNRDHFLDEGLNRVVVPEAPSKIVLRQLLRNVNL
jgi:hypothetical protein